MHEPNAQSPEVAVTNTGFRLGGVSGESLAVAWDDVAEIVAYKWDVWGYDIICLGFRRRGGEGYIEVGEDFTDYEEFVPCVEARFPLAKDWRRRVAFPAFATNWATIWTATNIQARSASK
ncbi:MAG: hypothetical protein RIC55_19545 [Pirellulaceae bacterium]